VRVVADTNTLLSAALWSGKPAIVMRLAQLGRVNHYTSEYILGEAEELLRSPKFTNRLALIHRTVAAVMRDFRRSATVVSPADLRDVSRDSDDDVILGTALSARAKVIVSRDKDLLVLNRFRGIEILDSTAFLREYFPIYSL
jgi:hypothetical protein